MFGVGIFCDICTLAIALGQGQFTCNEFSPWQLLSPFLNAFFLLSSEERREICPSPFCTLFTMVYFNGGNKVQGLKNRPLGLIHTEPPLDVNFTIKL